MPELNMEAVQQALRDICVATDNGPFVLAFQHGGEQMHMLSNMSREGVHELLKSCTKQAEKLAQEAAN